MAYKWLKKKKNQNEEMSLNITSMADIFTIILVFLIKAFSTGSASITPAQGLVLPVAQAAGMGTEALKVEIAKDSILVDDQLVAKIANNKFELKEFHQALQKQKEKQDWIAKQNPDVKQDSKIVIVADQTVPYSTLKAVLSSAATFGFSDFKLAVIQKE